eukprot:4244957-Lingulodinium_polyedra.AAC.1
MSEADALEVFKLLEAKRQEWAQTLAVHCEDFRTFMPGGKFLMERTGEVAQVIEAQARGQLTKEWVLKYNLPKLASFTIRKYGEPMASALALYWCHKMQTLYNIWKDQSDSDYIFKAADIETANESESLQKAVADLAPGHPAWSRIEDIKSIRP